MPKKPVKKFNKKVEKKAKAEIQKEPLLLQPPRGMKDILPEDQPYWDQVRRTTERLAR